jgi:hypothetical protein
MGQDKTKTLQAGLQDFRFFLRIPDLWDHPCPSEKSVVSFPPTARARGLLKSYGLRVTGGESINKTYEYIRKNYKKSIGHGG